MSDYPTDASVCTYFLALISLPTRGEFGTRSNAGLIDIGAKGTQMPVCTDDHE